MALTARHWLGIFGPTRVLRVTHEEKPIREPLGVTLGKRRALPRCARSFCEMLAAHMREGARCRSSELGSMPERPTAIGPESAANFAAEPPNRSRVSKSRKCQGWVMRTHAGCPSWVMKSCAASLASSAQHIFDHEGGCVYTELCANPNPAGAAPLPPG